MLTTDEIRWFFTDMIPSAVLDWFRDGVPISPAPGRTDIYLPLPASFELGIKLREGRLEIKTQSGPSRQVAYPNGVTGRAALWKKEAVRSDLVSDIESRLAHPSALSVLKQRYLRKFSLQAGRPVEITTASAPRQGCFLELAQLWLDDIPSWTIALEAIGAPAPLAGNLAETAAHIFGQSPCPAPLKAETCASYPEWLPLQRRTGAPATAGSRRS